MENVPVVVAPLQALLEVVVQAEAEALVVALPLAEEAVVEVVGEAAMRSAQLSNSKLILVLSFQKLVPESVIGDLNAFPIDRFPIGDFGNDSEINPSVFIRG